MSLPPEALPRHELERKLRRSRTINLLLGTVAVLGVLFGAIQWVQHSSVQDAAGAANGAAATGEPGTSPGAAQPASSFERRIADDPMAIGSVDAPIVLSEWIDFRCPYCAVFARDTFPQIVEEYVDAGLVRIEVNDVAYFGEQSELAAVAARAAGEQGRYFEFMKAIYDAAPESGHADLQAEKLIEFAEQVGVPDIQGFIEDLQSEELVNAVRLSTATAQQAGVTGVPFFAVGEQALSGAQPIESFRQFLEMNL